MFIKRNKIDLSGVGQLVALPYKNTYEYGKYTPAFLKPLEDTNMRLPKLSALFLTTAMAIGVTGQALAADIGDCGTPEEMTAKLRAEDQRSIASAQRVQQSKGGVVSYKGMIFTSNADRSVGYVLHADKPLGEKANKICVINRVQDIRFSDARKSNNPDSVFLNASDEDALKKCSELVREKKISQGTCGAFNKTIRSLNSAGVKVMFQAFNVTRQPDGSYKPDGTLTTVMGNVNGSLGSESSGYVDGVLGSVLYSSLPEGATVTDSVLAYPKYTEYGVVSLEQQMAARRAEK